MRSGEFSASNPLHTHGRRRSGNFNVIIRYLSLPPTSAGKMLQTAFLLGFAALLVKFSAQ